MDAHTAPDLSEDPEISKDTMKDKILAIQRGLEYSAKPTIPRRRKTDSPPPPKDTHEEGSTSPEESEEDDEQVVVPDPPIHGDKGHDREEIYSPAMPEASDSTGQSSQPDEGEESNDVEADPEVARRIAIRERMAKMSGGMGMHMGLGMAPPFAKPKSQPKPIPPPLTSPPIERQDPIPVIPGLPSRKSIHTERDARIVDENLDTSPNPITPQQLAPAFASELPSEKQGNLSSNVIESTLSVSSDEDDRSQESEDSDKDEDVHEAPQQILASDGSDEEEINETRDKSPEEGKSFSEQEPKSIAPQRPPSHEFRGLPPIPASRSFTESPRTARPPPPPPPIPAPSKTAPPPVPVPWKHEASLEHSTSSDVGYANSDDDISSVMSEEDYAGEHSASPIEPVGSPSSRPPLPPPPPPPPLAIFTGSPSISVPHPTSPPPIPTMYRNFESPPGHAANLSSFSPPPVPPMTSFGDRASADYSHDEPHPQFPTPSSPDSSPFRRTYTERQSLEASQGRGSLDANRRDGGYLAMKEENIKDGQLWWLETGAPPSLFRNRTDLVFEVEDSTSTKRGGRTSITREVYILYSDYSQTIVTAQYDRDDPSQAVFSQRHIPPPAPPTKRELETRHEQVGVQIVNLSQAKLGTCVGDGTPWAFITEIFSKLDGCLPSAGIRSHGALIYSNLGNSSTTQFDEIRPGDIVAFRSAVFQAHGGLRGKITTEVGKPDHVAVIQEWNGTKKKLKVLEQRRDHRKVAHNSYKIGDLKSGEVHVFRPMPRSWVDW